MFDISGGEFLVIGVVALIVIGPKELPGLLRTTGNALNKVRRMAAEFRGQFDEAMREAEIDQAKKAFNDMDSTARSATTSFNPLDTIRNEIKSVKEDMQASRQATPAADPLPEPKIEPPPPAPPVNITAEAKPEPVAEEPAPKPKRSRKKADEPGTPA
jgi:sec-independent protein translocase protein TatB